MCENYFICLCNFIKPLKIDANFFNGLSAIANTVSAIIALFGVYLIFIAKRQLEESKKIAQIEFESKLYYEYRDLINKIPVCVMLDEDLDDFEFQIIFDDLYRYFDLTNEQISFRRQKLISKETWLDWKEGIESTMKLKVFCKAWNLIINSSNPQFSNLRKLKENYEIDPINF